jgi:hypothetical protein
MIRLIDGGALSDVSCEVDSLIPINTIYKSRRTPTPTTSTPAITAKEDLFIYNSSMVYDPNEDPLFLKRQE